MWRIVQDLVRDGSTVLLTTQYLDEADRLSDSVVVLSEGRVVASGAPAELKAQIGERTVTLRFAAVHDVTLAMLALQRAGLRPVCDERRRSVTVPVTASRDVAVVVRALDDAGVEADELALAEPRLDEVYMLVTRRAAAAAG
jgi:ABC-2 type transport system ATP-binding protein